MHKQFVLAFSVPGHLFTYLFYYVLLSFPSEHEVPLSFGKLILHFLHILVTYLLEWRHITEIDTLSKSSVDTTLKHAWEARYCNTCFLVDIAHLLISKAIEHVISWLWVRIRHLNELSFSSLSNLCARKSWMINWSSLRREAMLLKTGKWFWCCHRKYVPLMKGKRPSCGCCLLVELLNCTFLLKLDPSVYCCHTHLSCSIITINLCSVTTCTLRNKIKRYMVLRFEWDATRSSDFQEPNPHTNFHALLFFDCLI